MVEALGESLRAARMQHGWDQAEFARRVGVVTQQTVSRWELGTSRPRRTMIPQIADVLELDSQALLDAAGYDSRSDRSSVTRPVLPLLPELPIHELPEDVFERFATDLAHLLYPPPNDVHGYGARGHKQDGIDIEIRHPQGRPTAIQCKRVKDFGPSDVRNAVEALTMDVRECLLFVTRVASTAARREIAAHPGWRLLDRVDISRTVYYLPDRDAAIRLVEKYFRGYREAFFGISQPSPWESVEDFFRPLTGTPVFNHDWPLVGRVAELNALNAFLASAEADIAVIIGSGGLGKTRLLREFAAGVVAERGFTARFVAPDTPIEPSQFEYLPVTNHLVVILDDAQARTDIAMLVRGIRRQRPDAKIVMSARPYAESQLTNDLRNAGVFWEDCTRIRLGELTLGEARSLAREILGADSMPALVELLAAAAPDCPLIIVSGAVLIKRGTLEPNRLRSSDQIRRVVLEAFRDAMTGAHEAGDADLRRQVIEAVAALQPFRLDDDGMRSTIAGMVGRPFDQVMPYLRNLEGAGVLLRRRNALRVVPDLLGDAVLAAACVDVDSGILTGYLQRLQEVADGAALAHVLVNASRIDWQIKQEKARGNSLVEPLWAHIQREFESADIEERIGLLQLLRKVAAFQPAFTLELAQWAIDHPTAVYDPSRYPQDSPYAPNYRDVLDELAPLLENVAYHLEFIERAASMLWRLAQHDLRPTNQHPHHPIRVLGRIMDYVPGRSEEYRERLLALAERWFENEDVAALPYSPFDIIEPLLATSGMSETSDERALTLHRYRLTPAAAGPLRDRVIDRAFIELESANAKRAHRAAAALDHALTYPLPFDPNAEDHWTDIFIAIIERITATVTTKRLHPVALIGLRQALKWHRLYSPTGTKPAAQAAWAALPNGLEDQLALALHDGWGALLLDDDDPALHEQRREEQFRTVATAAIEVWSDSELVDRLEHALADQRLAFDQGVSQALNFTWTLTRIRPAIATALCHRVLEDHTRLLRDLIPAALGRLLEARPEEGLALARTLISTANTDITRSVAYTFSWGRGARLGLIDGEEELLGTLLTHTNEHVRSLAVAAGRVLAQTHPAVAAKLVGKARFAESTVVAEAVASVFLPPSPLRWSELPSAQAAELLQQLRDCPAIDVFPIHHLLTQICVNDPRAVAQLLMDRVEHWEQIENGERYRPLPFSWYYRPDFSAYQQYGELLRQVLRWIADGLAFWKRRYEGREVFALIAGSFNEEVVSALRSALESGDTELIGAVGTALSRAPRALAWDNVEFVRHALRIAQQHGERAVQQVGGGLHEATMRGMRSSGIGQPCGEDMEQRDKSVAILNALPKGSIEAEFYQSLVDAAEQRIRWDIQSDNDFTDRRYW